MIPLLIISDAITAPTGLARVSRELAVRIHESMPDVFRIGTCGLGGSYSRKFPFPQYPITISENWMIPELPKFWEDFAGDEKGIVLAIWNASWLSWLADPTLLPNSDLKTFLKSQPFSKWLYCPVDSDGPGGRIPESQIKIMAGFDRVATYTKWAVKVIESTALRYGNMLWNVQALPHGTDSKVFCVRSQEEARKLFIKRVVKVGDGVIRAMPGDSELLLIGVCATNTARKDWALAFATCGELLKRKLNVGLWAHTDSFRKYWDLPTLADEFGMRDRVIFTNGHIDDEDMAWGYAACDVTLGIGSGEGWGLPISESLACGIPCITGDYAGAAEFVPNVLKIVPKAFRYDGYYMARRPVFEPKDWADRIQMVTVNKNFARSLPSKYFWDDGAWDQWEKWLRAGIQEDVC